MRPGQGFCNEDHRETLEGWLFAAESWQGCSLAASILYRGSPQPLSLVACGDYGGPAFAGSCWQLLVDRLGIRRMFTPCTAGFVECLVPAVNIIEGSRCRILQDLIYRMDL